MDGPDLTRKDQDARVLKAAVDKGLISQALAERTQQRASATQTAVTALLIKDGVLTQHIVDNLVSSGSEPELVAGFRILGALGQGGMGTVYRALQVSMNREVALKVIARQFATDPVFCERFLREARAAGQVNHPNVITCYDVGQDQEWLYMALELMTGGDASSLARSSGGIVDEGRALRLIDDCARGLGALKRAGLIHRDIKPANIFISQDGFAKLGDLGLARSTSGDDRMTMTGAAMGTPAFMSPEQASGESDLDIRTDIYALGASLYALLTGDTPFKGPSAFAVVAKVLNDPTPDPRAANPALSDGAAAVVMAAMAKDRNQRYPTPEAMSEDIERVLSARPTIFAVAPPRPPPAAPIQGAARTTTPLTGQRQLGTTSPTMAAAQRSEAATRWSTRAPEPPGLGHGADAGRCRYGRICRCARPAGSTRGRRWPRRRGDDPGRGGRGDRRRPGLLPLPHTRGAGRGLGNRHWHPGRGWLPCSSGSQCQPAPAHRRATAAERSAGHPRPGRAGRGSSPG